MNKSSENKDGKTEIEKQSADKTDQKSDASLKVTEKSDLNNDDDGKAEAESKDTGLEIKNRNSDNAGDSGDRDSILKITDLKKSFGKLDVLKNVNLNLKKGETVVILGRSGTGKSVILECIIGLLEPDSGNIEVFGQEFLELRDNEKNKLRIKIGFLFQSGALYDSMTVRQNLEFPVIRQPDYKKEDITGKVQEQLKNVGLEDAIDKVPSELSGGMKKRIGLARTLMLDPEIILYDEPTTGLDPFTSNEISELILSMQKKLNVTSLIVTHDMACARLVSNRIVVLKNGEFAAEGTYEELEKSDDEFVKGFFEFS